jgi:phosphoglycerate dehydrogenase-like enzyme
VPDVTGPDALPPGHPLWKSDNALITPHLAGSQGNEWLWLADLALAEVERLIVGDGFAHPVRRETLEFIA